MSSFISCFKSVEIMNDLRERILNMDINDIDDIFNYIYPDFATDIYYKPLMLDLIQQILYYKLYDNKKAILCLYFKLLAHNIYNIDLTKLYFSNNYIYEYRHKKESHIIKLPYIIKDIQEEDKINIYNNNKKLIMSFNIKNISYLNNCVKLEEVNIIEEQQKFIKFDYKSDDITIKFNTFININYDLIKAEIENNNIGCDLIIDQQFLNNKIYNIVDVIKNDDIDNFTLYYYKHEEQKEEFIKLIQMFGALKCFKFLYLSGAIKEITKTNYLIIGNNLEMIKISERLNLNYVKLLVSAIRYNKDYLFEYCLNNIKDITYKKICKIIETCLMKHNYNMIESLYNYHSKIIFKDEFIREAFKYYYKDLNNLNGIILFNKLDKRFVPALIDEYLLLNKLLIVNFSDEFINLLMTYKEEVKLNLHLLLFTLLKQQDINIKSVKRYLKMIYNIDDINCVYDEVSKFINKTSYYKIDEHYIIMFINNLYYNDHYKNNIINDEEEILNCFLCGFHADEIDISNIRNIYNIDSSIKIINVLSPRTKIIFNKHLIFNYIDEALLYDDVLYNSNIENFNFLILNLIEMYKRKNSDNKTLEISNTYISTLKRYITFEHIKIDICKFIVDNLQDEKQKEGNEILKTEPWYN